MQTGTNDCKGSIHPEFPGNPCSAEHSFLEFRMKKGVISLCAFLLVLLSHRSALPIGLGGFFDLTSSGNVWTGKTIRETESDMTPNGGFILDTPLSKKNTIHYRFSAGAGSTFTSDRKFYLAGVTHTFGFSPYSLRGDEIRFWLGPRIGMFYTGGKYRFVEPLISNKMAVLFPAAFANPILLSMPLRHNMEAHFFRAEAGLVFAGFDFSFGESATVSFGFCINYSFTVGRDNYSNTIMAHGWEVSSNIAALYRLKEKAAPPQ
jgi:hypothetical protein